MPPEKTKVPQPRPERKVSVSGNETGLLSELLDARWYFRYPVGLAVLAGVVWTVALPVTNWNYSLRAWGYGLGLAFGLAYALLLFREVSKWVLGLSFAWWVVNGLQDGVNNLTVPGAIIVGAIIIAWAIYESRTRRK